MAKPLAPPRICISATGTAAGELLDCASQALERSRFVELRLDWPPHPKEVLPLIPKLLERSRTRYQAEPAVIQATCRREQNGGRFRGTVSAQVEVLKKAAEAGCQLLDLEVESAEETGPEAVAALRAHASLILSFHDFQRTARLATAARRLLRFPADFYKLVPTATRQSDNCAILDFLSSVSTEDSERTEKTEKTEGTDRGKWIAFCMGEAGTPSRVLALARGSAWVYAALPSPQDRSSRVASPLAEKAAPGQIDFHTLRHFYRAEKLGPHSALYGLLGYPVRHSVGAAVHNAAFRAQGLDAVYLPLLASDLSDFRKAAQRYPLAGFSITIPHKQKILSLVDQCDRSVELAGAVNTVRVRRGRWEAINTDIEGIMAPLRRALRLRDNEFLPCGFRAVVVGTGGASRASLAALRLLRCRHIALSGRNAAKVAALAKERGAQPLAVEQLRQERFDLMIHATSVGMWPHRQECFLQPEHLNAAVVFDLVYNPIRTRLLQLADARGCRIISGLEMFLAQAACQFEYWTGSEPPVRLMRKTAEEELARLAEAADQPAIGRPIA